MDHVGLGLSISPESWNERVFFGNLSQTDGVNVWIALRLQKMGHPDNRKDLTSAGGFAIIPTEVRFQGHSKCPFQCG